jgi:hypothetical protein
MNTGRMPPLCTQTGIDVCVHKRGLTCTIPVVNVYQFRVYCVQKQGFGVCKNRVIRVQEQGWRLVMIQIY